MKLLKTIVKELWGLFVDDESLALALVMWIALCGFGLPMLPIPATGRALILTLGTFVILIATVVSAARRSRRSS